jgi:hypothetical protein
MPTIQTIWPALLIGLYASGFALMPATQQRLLWALPPVAVQFSWWLLRTADRWVTVFLFAILTLPPLPVKMGDSGPHIGIAIAALGLVAGVLRMDEWRGAMRRSELLLLAYVLILLLSLAPALVIHPTSLVAASFVRVALFAISIYVYFYTAHGPAQREAPAVRLMFYAGILSAAFACLDFVFQFPPPAGFGPQYVWLSSGVYRRAQGVFYEASTLGNVCVFFLIFIAASLLRPVESKISRPMLTAGAAVFVAALVLSFSRASLLNLGIALAALLYVNRRRIRLMRLGLFALTGSLIAAAATLAFAPHALEFYFMRMLGSMELLAAGNEAVLSGRVATWNFIGSYLADHPVQAMIGVGYKTLPYSDFVGRRIVADNAYLSALLETGILGLTGILLLNLAILRIAFRSGSFYGQWIGCFWIGQMFQMLSGDLLTYWRVLPVYFWVLALSAREGRAEHS